MFAGTLASKYENLGGEVKWMGKPDKVILIVLIRLALARIVRINSYGLQF